MFDRQNNIISISGKQLIAGATEYPVWGNQAVYVQPTAGMQMELVSSSANDAAAGTGARTVEVTYIEATTYLEKKEIVTLNGTTPVATVAVNMFRINKLRVLTTGSGQKAAGKIDIRNLADTPIYGTILAGANESQQCIYTVPAGKTLKIKMINCALGSSAAGKSTTFSLKSNYDHELAKLNGAGASAILYEAHAVLSMDSAVCISFPDPIVFPEKSEIVVTCVGTAAGVATYDARGVLE